MLNRVLYSLVFLGVVGGLTSAYVYAKPPKPLPPVFNPAPNPYAKGIYANGIIESTQSHGENVNVMPEVSGTVAEILVAEGEHVHKGAPLLRIDDTIQRATAAQQAAQAEAAHAMLQELRAEPRRENLEVTAAQVELAQANLRTARDTYDKNERSYEIEPRSVSKDALDSAANAAKVAKANLDVAQRQYELTKAGAWVYDVRNQERQVEALSKAAAASAALLGKYTLLAPFDGKVLLIGTSVGSYVSPQGGYDPYTQGFGPVVVLGTPESSLSVRTYIDEILIPKLPPIDKMKATMFVRGTNLSVPLELVRVQPYVSPKIELSNERLEKVDLRVLPIIFRFQPPPGLQLFPGELVDVYVGES
jgi:HlyD family secretion protein